MTKKLEKLQNEMCKLYSHDQMKFLYEKVKNGTLSEADFDYLLAFYAPNRYWADKNSEPVDSW